MKKLRHISWFVTPHGFGHAARAAAVMGALHDADHAITFDIFTSVPEFFFLESLKPETFTYHKLQTDIGLVQHSALVSDIPATLRRLNEFLPFDSDEIKRLGTRLKELNTDLVLCDIAPMGISAAKAAGIPSVLIENFTWDWIYDQYSNEYPSIKRHIEYLGQLFDSAGLRIQAAPICRPLDSSLKTPPISRPPVHSRDWVREKLSIPPDSDVVIISMGGVREALPFPEKLKQHRGTWFIIPGSPSYSRAGQIIRLPHDSGFYHPELVNASDVLIGKTGYSTVAEVFQSGIPFGAVSRANFREATAIEGFISQKMPSVIISEDEFRTGNWLERLPELKALPRAQRSGPNGADTAAEIIRTAVF